MDLQAQLRKALRAIAEFSNTEWQADTETARLKMAKSLLPDFDHAAAREIAFHLTDWADDAVCFVALILRPDAFTVDETREVLKRFLIHAPNHLAAAAKLGGWPITDVFAIGALNGKPDELPDVAV